MSVAILVSSQWLLAKIKVDQGHETVIVAMPVVCVVDAAVAGVEWLLCSSSVRTLTAVREARSASDHFPGQFFYLSSETPCQRAVEEKIDGMVDVYEHKEENLKSILYCVNISHVIIVRNSHSIIVLF